MTTPNMYTVDQRTNDIESAISRLDF